MTDREIEQLYLEHRPRFSRWAGRCFRLGAQDALDLYQDAVVVFVRNVRVGRLDPVSCTPVTYLFAIGRNLALKRLRDGKRTLAPDELDDELLSVPADLDELMREEHHQYLVRNGMARLSDREREIIRLYYFEERSMAEIASLMGYKNADVAKKMKHVSFQKLAEFIGRAELPQFA
jgi:RNA polymerase sigma factor (sigma-70 family)